MKVGLAIQRVTDSERELQAELLAAADRHKDEHDVHHVAQTLAQLSASHLEALAPCAERYGAAVDTEQPRPKEAGDPGPEPAIRLLDDLRELYVLASRTSIDWVALGQGAQAARDEELLSVVSSCHPETLRQVRWVTTRVKEAAPQVLTS